MFYKSFIIFPQLVLTNPPSQTTLQAWPKISPSIGPIVACNIVPRLFAHRL